jgi:phospholipase/carboxylesterase
MAAMSKAEGIFSIDNWVMRFHRPEGAGPFPVLLMLHGWTGDENSMWVFAPRLLKNSLMIAPRGLYTTKGSGYSWHPEISKPWPWVNDFVPAVEKLFDTISSKNLPEGDFSELHIIGFSQGAALAYTMTILYSERIASIAGLSGFLPDGASPWIGNERLKGLPIFIAHGTEDERVPIERARMSVDLLQKSGASVTYCEDNVGHKLSAKCFHGLEAFYQRVNY